MRVAALLLCAMLAACGSNDKAASTAVVEERGSVREREVAQVAAAKELTGWDRVFASPAQTVGTINQAGFGLPDYAASKVGAAHTAAGIDRLMSRSTAPTPNMATATVAGSAADRIDQISYVLKLNDPEDAATARDRFAGLIAEFLTRAQITDGAPLVEVVRAGRSAEPVVGGRRATVTATDTRIDVTFLRPAATGASTNS
ncbi:hypothetical protein [uncultured Sphingomonas sp.]|uniref:hypothetical protein n=1 Tax=uncultured Sphingomonas sp. TaxID=158754 RepID=UPI0035CB565B